MAPDSITTAGHESESDTLLRRILGGMSVFSMLMTIPQVWTIWVNREAAGVSLASWSAYLRCIGWIALDIGVIVGVMLSR